MNFPFSWFELRTTQPHEALSFYAGLLGLTTTPRLELCLDGEPVAHASLLPDRARAAGAPAHWLGYVAVADVEATFATWCAQGGERLGPPAKLRASVPVKDLSGAVLGLGVPRIFSGRSPVAWHLLHANDAHASLAAYGAVFGWRSAPIAFGPEAGEATGFALKEGGAPVGAMFSSAKLPGRHAHWMHCFRVPSLDGAMARARSLGAKSVGEPRQIPGGGFVVNADDPQGAAFGLWAPSR